MARAVLSEVFSQIPWDRKFAFPVNEDKALETEIQRKQNEIANMTNTASKYKERTSAMTEHQKNVQQELTHTQGLCRAIESQTESEVHFKAMAERETGRLQQDISQLRNELMSLQDMKFSQEKSIFQATQKIEKLKAQLNWDQQTLDAWLDESARKDDDTMAIVKYARQDERRIRELTLSVEKLALEVNQKRKSFDNELTETILAQVALEKTVEMVHQAHTERQELINQWENSIQQMKKKDQDLQQCALLLAETNHVIRERKTVIKEKQEFLDREVDNNKDCEKKLAAIERQANRLQRQFQEQEGNRTQLQDELVSLKGRLDRTVTDLEAKRSHLMNIKKDINKKTEKLEDVQQNNIAFEEKLHSVTEETLSVEERAAHMEQLLRFQEKHLKEIDTQFQRAHKLLFQKKQELQALIAKEKNIIAEISSSHVTLSNLDSCLRKVDENALKKQEYINNQEFQIQLLEGKLARLSGNMDKKEKRALENQVSELMELLEGKKKAATMLTAQLKKMQNDIRCVKKENEKTGSENKDLTAKIDELNLIDDTMDKDLKKLRLKEKDRIVEKNILQLDVKRLRNLLYDKADGVLSLEKRKLQLQRAIKERHEEIDMHREMHSKQLKCTEQEMQGLRAQLHERLSRVDKTKKKYEIIIACMAAPEGEEDKSQAYYIIKTAQEKEELQRKGDDLDTKIRKAEKETKALENTMHLFNNHNSAFRKSLNTVTENSPEYQEKLKLEEQKKAADEKLRFKKQQIRELQENIEVLISAFPSFQHEEAAQLKRNEDYQARIAFLNKELISQKGKLERATKQSSKLTKEIRGSKNVAQETFEERDIKLKELKECKKAVNKLLLEVMERHPDLQAILQTSFQQAGVALPSPASTPSSRSSKLSSARTCVSLRSSTSSASSSVRGSAVHSPSINKVELDLGLSASSEILHQPPGSRSIGSNHVKSPSSTSPKI